ncbi:MAG: hypothetical protein ISR85_04445 [Kiritimatiellales bacterium]|nr:hypothetical protein [Kiritimatiellota bacterium]MBL7012160.1 hypothetical protein [Kiritimatiellales bacterium]
MLYLVSGASRSGKTIIANNILKQKQIPYVSLDWLVMGFTNGIPEYGIHDRLFPDEIAEKLWSFLKAMCESMLWLDGDYVIEGEAILPNLVRELLDKYPDQIKICFVGYTDVDVDKKAREIKTYSDGTADWLTKESDDHIRDHIDNMVTHSRRIKADCETYGISYFDTSTDFPGTIEEAIDYLLREI